MHNGTSVLLKKIKNFDRSELWRSKINLHGYLEKKKSEPRFHFERSKTSEDQAIECHLYNILFINM